MKSLTVKRLIAAALCIACTFAGVARAEQTELRIAKQYGLAYLQMMVLEDQKIVEKNAKAAGLGDLKVTWATFRSSDVMNDALLSGSVDFVCLGIPGIATIWAKTKGANEVKAASGFNFLPLQLNTRSPNIKSLRDLTEKDKIALPAVKVSMQAIVLQMAAAQTFGEANYTKLDGLTVSMAHPDAMATFLSGGGEINNHFTSPPFIQKEMEKPGITKVLNSVDVLGGPISFNVVAATSKFHGENPKLYAVFLKSLQEATDFINKDKRAAADIYIKVTKDKSPVEDILKIMNDPQTEYSLMPKNIMKMVDFMHKTGTIKIKPDSWKDLFFPNMHNLAGS
ncbi:MAG: putative periplasmic subtsrate-binding protein [Betaproteobacteria bacterium]|nr:putative periplasmic subtsrate-binding protein [Betaproteobacteria bacterium]